jgi:hypothetical protein
MCIGSHHDGLRGSSKGACRCGSAGRIWHWHGETDAASTNPATDPPHRVLGAPAGPRSPDQETRGGLVARGLVWREWFDLGLSVAGELVCRIGDEWGSQGRGRQGGIWVCCSLVSLRPSHPLALGFKDGEQKRSVRFSLFRILWGKHDSVQGYKGYIYLFIAYIQFYLFI